MGKYDLVEAVLAELGAEFFFDAVAIRPGKPAVFGVCKGKPVFGLPGNPLSTMVTFELFVAPAVDVLGGAFPQPLTLMAARLGHPIREKGAVTHFLPARLGESGGVPEVSALGWQGSGDVVSLTQSNAFMVVPGDQLERAAGDWVTVLPRRVPGAGQ
jgi:molybdopterin molybdotransferase